MDAYGNSFTDPAKRPTCVTCDSWDKMVWHRDDLEWVCHNAHRLDDSADTNEVSNTPRTDSCPHCGAEFNRVRYACGKYPSWAWGRTELCLEREARQKAEAEVERLTENFKLTTIELAEIRDALHKKYWERTEKAEAEVERLRELLNQTCNEIEKTPFHTPRLTAFTAHRLAERYRDLLNK